MESERRELTRPLRPAALPIWGSIGCCWANTPRSQQSRGIVGNIGTRFWQGRRKLVIEMLKSRVNAALVFRIQRVFCAFQNKLFSNWRHRIYYYSHHYRMLKASLMFDSCQVSKYTSWIHYKDMGTPLKIPYFWYLKRGSPAANRHKNAVTLYFISRSQKIIGKQTWHLKIEHVSILLFDSNVGTDSFSASAFTTSQVLLQIL